jgi:hypothetical protein
MKDVYIITQEQVERLKNEPSETMTILRSLKPVQRMTPEQIFDIQYDIEYGKGGFTPDRFARAIESHILGEPK